MTDKSITHSSTAAKAAKATQKSKGAHLGDFVWIEARVGTGLVRRDEVRAALRVHGIDDSCVTEMSSQVAFSRAINAYDLPENSPFEIKRTSKGSRKVAVRRVRGNDLDQRTEAIALLEADDNLGIVAKYKDASPPQDLLDVVDGFRRIYDHHKNFVDSGEVASYCRTAVKALGGQRLMLRGVLYWMPLNAGRDVRALSVAMSDVGVAYVSVVPVNDTPEGRESVGRGMANGFMQEIEQISRRLSRMDGRHDDEEVGEVRASTVESRFNELDELRVRIDVMSGVLDHHKDALYAGLKSAQDAAVALIAKINSAA